jgi:Uma2 family endonuclease
MATAVSQMEQRVVLHEVSWITYEHLLADHLDYSSPRFTYDEGTLEIMSPSTEHEEINQAIAMLVELIAGEWRSDLRNLGSTTFKREDLKRGFELILVFISRMLNGCVARKKLIYTLTRCQT